MPLVLVLLLALSSGLPAGAVPGVCFRHAAIATPTGYTRTLQHLAPAVGWSVHTDPPAGGMVRFWQTVIVSNTGGITRTTTLSETAVFFGYAARVITARDVSVTAQAPHSFLLLVCRPDVSPFVFAPLLQRRPVA